MLFMVFLVVIMFLSSSRCLELSTKDEVILARKEIEHEYKFQKDSLSLVVDCLKYVSSRKDVKDHDVVV